MGRYIPPEKMTKEQIFQEIEAEYTRWNYIANNGCQDPFWPDGCNMNLIRNHIIYWYSILATKQAEPAEQAEQLEQEQISLFSLDEKDALTDTVDFQIKPIPPEVPSGYMVRECKYSNRLKDRKITNIVWGDKGEYKA